MVACHSPLVSSKQPSFEQPRDQMNPGQQLNGSVLAFVTQNCHLMMVAVFSQVAVALPSIAMHNTAGLNSAAHKLLQSACRGVRNTRHANPSDAATIFL